jgi:hypothetical protein
MSYFLLQRSYLRLVRRAYTWLERSGFVRFLVYNAAVPKSPAGYPIRFPIGWRFPRLASMQHRIASALRAHEQGLLDLWAPIDWAAEAESQREAERLAAAGDRSRILELSDILVDDDAGLD